MYHVLLVKYGLDVALLEDWLKMSNKLFKYRRKTNETLVG